MTLALGHHLCCIRVGILALNQYGDIPPTFSTSIMTQTSTSRLSLNHITTWNVASAIYLPSASRSDSLVQSFRTAALVLIGFALQDAQYLTLTPRQCEKVVNAMKATLIATSAAVPCGFGSLFSKAVSCAECAVRVAMTQILPNL
jgi:hypothetical protein